MASKIRSFSARRRFLGFLKTAEFSRLASSVTPLGLLVAALAALGLLLGGFLPPDLRKTTFLDIPEVPKSGFSDSFKRSAQEMQGAAQ